MNLFPRLPTSVAVELVEEIRFHSIDELLDRSSFEHPMAIYASTGGTPIQPTSLNEICQDLRRIAEDAGNPERRQTNYRHIFDSEVSILLHLNMNISPSEASCPEIWQFMTCICVPDLVLWRFPPRDSQGITQDRLLGGYRNLLRRLWWRAEILADEGAEDHYWILRQLGEDNLVQVMERPRLYGDIRLSKSTCRLFLATLAEPTEYQIRQRQNLMRDFQARILRLFPLVSFQAISQSDLDTLLQRELDASIEIMRTMNPE